MAELARQQVKISQFPGLATRADAMDIPPGSAVIQENVQSSNEGSLRSRWGVRQVQFEEE